MLSFFDIFRNELDVVNYRRRTIQDGAVARARSLTRRGSTDLFLPDVEVPFAENPHFLTPRIDAALAESEVPGRETTRTVPGSNLVGLALSGGGIRSASFSLGVLQGLDSLSKHNEPRVIDAIDYVSAVSGGGYIGTSLVAGLMQENATFPFDSRLDEQEAPETQHLRDYSNFLAANGGIDYLVSFALILRGILVNAVIVLPVLLLLAVLTVAIYPRPDLYKSFTLTLILAGLTAVFMVASAIYISFRPGTLRSREILGQGIGLLVVLVLVAALFQAQPYILAAIMSRAGGPANMDMTWLSRLFALLTSVATVLIAASQKLANVAKASIGEATWTASLKKYASRIALYVAAIIVPLLLWLVYIGLSYWAIQNYSGNRCAAGTADWMRWLTLCDFSSLAIYLVVALAIVVVTLFIGPNANSLHKLYRDRLSRAFLFERAQMGTHNAPSDVDTWKFSSLKPRAEATGAWLPSAAYAPYLLTNTAINLEASEDLNKRGRNGDTFIFSPLHVGSWWTGYVPTTRMEAIVPDLSLATAMAVSGAAASANMGRNTIKVLTFSLSLLNIRLGYWLANPARLDDFHSWRNRWKAKLGTWFFAMETLGKLNEKRLNVYLTDGGHIENLGIYELLRRRCKVIVAVDAEADPNMTFSALVNLEVMARIDLGIRIELPWQALQSSATGVTATALYGPNGLPGKLGPHAVIGQIRYDDGQGILIYIKASLSGDENDYVLDYKRHNPAFPHETTVDQFFSEEQFEAYRSLGFHATRGLFAGDDDFAKPRSPSAEWEAEVSSALQLLNIPYDMRTAILGHIAEQRNREGEG
ncbi:patatin-like phospholipase family protein [Phyllobacterium sp. SYP-B3895]|uniref:patatin-like phospholipase family protein n=1 Tax=Phyllobacterium sp. SYP-B3895 TaxID=2663240 RepID=UPI001AEF6530